MDLTPNDKGGLWRQVASVDSCGKKSGILTRSCIRTWSCDSFELKVEVIRNERMKVCQWDLNFFRIVVHSFCLSLEDCPDKL